MTDPRPVRCPAPLPPARSVADGHSCVAEVPRERPDAARAGTTPQGRSGRDLLRGTPQEILGRLAAGDPLELGPRVRRALRRRRLLFDDARALLRAFATCARYSGRYRGRPALARWLDAQVELALDTLLEEPPAGPPTSRELELARRLHLDPERLALACARFHRLPFAARDAFFQLVLDGRPLDDLAYPGGRSAVEIARDARRALAVFLELRPARPSQEIRS